MNDTMKLVLTVFAAVVLAGVAYKLKDYNFQPYIDAARAKFNEWYEWVASLYTYVKPWFDWVRSWFNKAS